MERLAREKTTECKSYDRANASHNKKATSPQAPSFPALFFCSLILASMQRNPTILSTHVVRLEFGPLLVTEKVLKHASQALTQTVLPIPFKRPPAE